ncbi:MAG: hypothetical protein LAT53_07260 [Idiomarina sp.]|nr:hypothetical protein [Idiomarina sp.]
MTKIALKKIHFIDVSLPTGFARQNQKMAEALLEQSSLETLLEGLRAIQCNRRVYALEKFNLIQALQQLAPSLTLNCSIITVRTVSDVKTRVAHEMTIASVSSVAPILIAEFERANKVPHLLCKQQLIDVLGVSRSAPGKHKEKFIRSSHSEAPAQPSGSLAQQLAHIPPERKEDKRS